MIRFLICLLIGIFSSGVGYSEVLSGSISYEVPSSFYGTWRVSSVMIDSDSPSNFKKKSSDIWNLYHRNGVITLTNPFSGATSSVNINYVNQNFVKFSSSGNFDGKILTDTVEITIDNDEFFGINTIVLDTLSNVDNKIIKSAKATYRLKGEKIAGMSIGEE